MKKLYMLAQEIVVMENGEEFEKTFVNWDLGAYEDKEKAERRAKKLNKRRAIRPYTDEPEYYVVSIKVKSKKLTK